VELVVASSPSPVLPAPRWLATILPVSGPSANDQNTARRGGIAPALLVEQAGWSVEDLRTVTVNALKSAFVPFDERNALIEDVVLPGYASAL
jgi:hypothetical protein